MDDRRRDDVAQPRVRRDARENRQRLLAAAKELFGAQGVETTTMNEIARAAGVGQGTLYRHFADKGALCQALVREDVVAFQGRLGAVISGDWVVASPLARLDMLLSEKIRLTESHLSLLAAMEAGKPRGARPGRGPFYTWLHEQIARLLDEAVSSGEAPPLDTAIAADAILAATAPQLYHAQRHELGYTSERISAGIRALFIDALRRLT